MTTFFIRLPVAAGLLIAACAPASVSPSSALSSTGKNLVVRSGVGTLNVINESGRSYHISGMPDFHPGIPQPSWGVYSFADIGPGTTCLALPSEIDNIGTNVTTQQVDTLRWYDSQRIGFFLLDPTSGMELAQLDWFAPGSAPGWRLNIAADGSTQLTSGTACTLPTK